MNYKNIFAKIRLIIWVLVIMVLHYIFINQVLLDRIVERSKYAFSYVRASKKVEISFPWTRVDRLVLYAFSPHHEEVRLLFVGDEKFVDTLTLHGGSWTLWRRLEVEFPEGVKKIRIISLMDGPFPWALTGIGFRRVDGSWSFRNMLNPYEEVRITGTSYVELYGRGRFNRFSWDGGWYRTIFLRGYSYNGNPFRGQTPQFPPLYPLVSRVISFITGKGEYSLVITSTLFALLSLLAIALLSDGRFGREISYKSTLLMTTYPASVHFYMAYSESLNIFLVILATSFLLYERYFPAFLLLGISTAARFQSLFYLPAFLLIYFLNQCREGKPLRKILPFMAAYAVVGASGVILFSLYLWHRFSDPIAWYKLNRFAWGNVHHFSSPIEMIWKNITVSIPAKMHSIIMTPAGDHILFLFLFGASLMIYALRKGMDRIFILSAIPFALLIFALFTQKVPFYESMTRHIYSIPTLFILLSLLFPWRTVSLLVALFSILLVFHTLSVDAFIMIHLPVILDTYVP